MNESNATTPTSTPAWRGWFRPSRRHKWKVVAEGDDEQAVHDRMLASARNGDFFLTQGEQDPNEDHQ